MTTMKYAASGEQRKQLINALSEVIGCESKYLRVMVMRLERAL